MLIKVCGMREADNVRQVEALGVDWMGFIFWSGTKRNNAVNPEVMSEKAKRVGVFVNEEVETMVRKAEENRLDYLQLHGKETPETCERLKATLKERRLNCNIIKAFSISTTDDIEGTEAYEQTCSYFLFDTKCKCVGGSGEKFDWSILDNYRGKVPFILSGGIGPESADDVKHFSHPQFAGIDLNSRFEDAPAQKNVSKLKQFISELKA